MTSVHGPGDMSAGLAVTYRSLERETRAGDRGRVGMGFAEALSRDCEVVGQVHRHGCVD